jgi:hypothetical protein
MAADKAFVDGVNNEGLVRITFCQHRTFTGLTQFNCKEGIAEVGQRHRMSVHGHGSKVDKSTSEPFRNNRGKTKRISSNTKHVKPNTESNAISTKDEDLHEGSWTREGRQNGVSAVSKWFGRDTLPDRLARALAERKAIDMREFCESFEFFTRIRGKLMKSMLGSLEHQKACRDKGQAHGVEVAVADLCCGHGLTGLLFAVFEKGIDRVYLVDWKKPQSHEGMPV